MPSRSFNLETRINTLKSVLSDVNHQRTLDTELRESQGNLANVLSKLEEQHTDLPIQKLALANSLADLTDDNLPVVRAIVDQPDVTDLRDVALRFNVKDLERFVDPETLPSGTPETSSEERKKIFAIDLRRQLFRVEPTAVLQRMVQDAEIPIPDTTLRTGVTTFLANQPDFNIRTTSIYTALKHPEALKDIPAAHQTGVIDHLKTLQRVQAISPVPEAIPALINLNLTAALHVTEMPESTFLAACSHDLGGETIARQVYTNAVNTRIRNEHTLMTLRETVKGSGLAVMDGSSETRAQRQDRLLKYARTSADQLNVPITQANLETIFGDMDYCECQECLSVYSPAAYFVELLQYLRNNNLDPKNPNTSQKGYQGTPLEKLFFRRPDLKCLELTCENTFTVLPYIDLVNEVMESFVVHLSEYEAQTSDPRRAKLEVFNVEDETSGELLAEPQHTNYQAYCILKSEVYPFTLPYHQPIDAARIFLNYLSTSRYELLDTFRSASETCDTVHLNRGELENLQAEHETAIQRAVDAEFLGLTQEEYIILTKEAFWRKEYFEITQQKNLTPKEYQDNIGVKDVHEYYGYDDEQEMTDLTEEKGLTFVKKQFLPRTGIQYVDLVEILKTQFINPNYPQGKALTILESIRFSYRFLQSFVDQNSADRYAKLIAGLEWAQPLVPAVEALLHPNECHQQKPDDCLEITDWENWVRCYFERIGQLIVLESGEGPQLPIEGDLFIESNPPQYVGTLNKDGTIVDKQGSIIGSVTISGQAIGKDGKPLVSQFDIERLEIKDKNNRTIGYIFEKNTVWWNPDNSNQGRTDLAWLSVQDTCNLDKVRLTHLDGSPLTVDEYDRIHRFIRLWRKMGWTIDETDKALVGLAEQKDELGEETSTPTGECDFVGFDTFKDDCSRTNGNGSCGNSQGTLDCPDIVDIPDNITADLIPQLVAVRKLLDLTGLPLIKLLTFWTNISTVGEKSLYSKLFLTHNLLGIDKVFKADKHGNYLTQSAKISEHIPVLMAALKLKADDITAIIQFCNLSDELTLANVSMLYRHSLLAKILHVKVAELPDVIQLFGNPFQDANATLALIETWGKMEDAGFTFRQLNYLIQNHDNPLRPLAPSKRTILQVTKTLYDGLNAIDRDHPDLKDTDKEQATTELVRTKAGLVFEPAIVEQILGLLEGTTVYATNAPLNLTITIPEDQKTLAKKLKYSNPKDATPPRAGIQVTGILTSEEQTQAKALSSDPDWAKAIDRVSKQPKNIFNDALLGIFPTAPEQDEAKSKLLAGDVLPPDGTTPLDKRFYFLQHFLPFLRRRLAHRLIIDTLAGTTGLSKDVADALLSEILTVGTSKRLAIQALEELKVQPVSSTEDWNGYLIPPTDEAFTFVTISETQPSSVLLDGQPYEFTNDPEGDPSNIWSTNPTPKLKSGKLYTLKVTGLSPDQMQWKTATLSKTSISTSALLPDYSKGSETEEVFTKLSKAALLVNGFSLNVDEINYLQQHPADFDSFDFNAVTLTHWKRLEAYTTLRNALPQTETTLLDLFAWATKPDDATKLSEKIVAVTAWKKENIEKLTTPKHFNLNKPNDFRNEVNLVKLQQSLQIADKIGVDIDSLFEWAKPGSKFWECHHIAEDIRKAIRARYDQEDWEQVVKPLNDQIRENQKQALISYLLGQFRKPSLMDEWNVVDADSLFEFFLIDVQMCACMETSRIKQAISTVQLFIQRCMFGLEDKLDKSGNQIGVPIMASGGKVPVLDRDRWDWMQKYRVWEVNRKVFLYPENWIDPQLRDDKSSFYKELESELLQKDLNSQTVQDALKNYLFKVDEVANLKVVGLFFDQDINLDKTPATDEKGNPVGTLHVFSRTRNAPYFFYYRYFATKEQNWYPWEKVQVDIPSYDVERIELDGTNKVIENGTYLIPVVWNKRLLIFFPQFMKKTAPNPNITSQPIKDIGNNCTPNSSKPLEYWEIKMAWSEYRNAKWTQKKIADYTLYDPPKNDSQNPSHLPSIEDYEFVPRLVPLPSTSSEGVIVIDVYRDTPAIGAFSFTGSQLSRSNEIVGSKDPNFNTDFHYTTPTTQIFNPCEIHSLQAVKETKPPLFESAPYFKVKETSVLVKLDQTNDEINFWHPFAHDLLSKLNTTDLDVLFDYYLQGSFDKADAYGGSDGAGLYNELKRPYSLYNWEVGFHALAQIVDRLLKSQQFDLALKMCHYIFNPLAEGKDDKRFWQFPPFKIDAKDVLEKLFLGLQPNAKDNTPGEQINEWRDKPFRPHVIARSRPSAYMKWTVMKYIEILIAYGDYYFRQNTLETIPMAIQCYVLASHIYGPRGQKIPKRGKIQPQTYNSLLDKWDAFGNAMVELELIAPFSNQTPFWFGASNGVVGFANIFGFATSLYFCIPDNPNLRQLGATIDDRLFKIRHCQDIEGVFRKLPLFEPPIEPGLLVQAVAQGLSISSVLNDLNSPMPNYRFYYLLQKALELCSELKSLGNAFLSTKEKGDAEALSQLRAKHESSIHNLVMEVRKQQLEESQKSLDALQQSRKSPVYRLQHYLKLIGEDLGKVPNDSTDFSELPNQIEQPVDESGLKLIAYEKEEMERANEANENQKDVAKTEKRASEMHALPNISFHIQPLGDGVSTSLGGSNIGSATQAHARSQQSDVTDITYQSTNAGRKGGFLRQLQDRVQQANIAGYEIKNIDKQILTQQIRISIANQEITNQQQQIDNAQEVEEFLRNKYTNQELYTWMEGQIRTLYHQTYTLAYEMAKKAEKVYRFERGLSTSNFIQFGYWDAGRDGLLAGEHLYLGLKQLEAAYQEKRGYDYEITKSVSLRQINPMALLLLRETGTCEFALPEVLFDMDHPGHYMRRIKSVALTIPCIVGPYTSLNCTLRLLEHEFRITALADKGGYSKKTDETDDRFNSVNVPISAIAVSTGQNDSGVFELNFRDERYVPFEGAGAISRWKIELPAEFRQFDYDTITDVVLQLRYTSVEGGDKLKTPAVKSVMDYIKSVEDLSRDQGLFAVFDLKHDFASEWYQAMNPPAGATDRVLVLNDLNERLPMFTKGRDPKKIQATDLYLYSSTKLSVSLMNDTDETPFTDGLPVGEVMKSFVIKDIDNLPVSSWKLKLKEMKTDPDQLWLIIRYRLA